MVSVILCGMAAMMDSAQRSVCGRLFIRFMGCRPRWFLRLSRHRVVLLLVGGLDHLLEVAAGDGLLLVQEPVVRARQHLLWKSRKSRAESYYLDSGGKNHALLAGKMQKERGAPPQSIPGLLTQRHWQRMCLGEKFWKGSEACSCSRRLSGSKNFGAAPLKSSRQPFGCCNCPTNWS